MTSSKIHNHVICEGNEVYVLHYTNLLTTSPVLQDFVGIGVRILGLIMLKTRISFFSLVISSQFQQRIKSKFFQILLK